ncbi:lymphocyte function-associated antigen 3 [Chroicocephalus ridibundus]|uniref:lymphocyte function-associated antigen 3 n=1 Tax=Chroicocephalus ridibundus TaxID=1192867 RepID=UPI002FDEC4B1
MRLPAWLGRLLLVASLLLAHIHCEEVFGIVGENFTFPVKIDQKPVEILWTKNKDKVAEWEGQSKTTYFTSLRNRGLLNEENGCLTIFNLENSDTGTYVLEYLDSMNKKYNLTFALAVLAPPPEPEISCNISGGDLALKCTGDFQKPLIYTWKFSSLPVTHQTQEVFISKNVDASEKATCIIKFSQTEKSSEISLTQCFPNRQGDSYDKRSRGGLIAAFVILILVGILVFLCRRGRTKLVRGNAAQNNSPVCGSGEHKPLCSVESQEQLNSDRELSTKQNSTPMSKCADDHGVTEGDISKEDNSSLQDKHADDDGVNEGEVTRGAEGGNEKRLSNSSSCSKEDLKSEAKNCSVDQTTMEEKR